MGVNIGLQARINFTKIKFFLFNNGQSLSFTLNALIYLPKSNSNLMSNLQWSWLSCLTDLMVTMTTSTKPSCLSLNLNQNCLTCLSSPVALWRTGENCVSNSCYYHIIHFVKIVKKTRTDMINYVCSTLYIVSLETLLTWIVGEQVASPVWLPKKVCYAICCQKNALILNEWYMAQDDDELPLWIIMYQASTPDFSRAQQQKTINFRWSFYCGSWGKLLTRPFWTS